MTARWLWMLREGLWRAAPKMYIISKASAAAEMTYFLYFTIPARRRLMA
jgi:hypothetical protein